MAILRLQCSFQRDTPFPADAIIINPHFEVGGGAIPGVDDEQLCEDLANALDTWDSGTGQITVKSYLATGPAPHFPRAEFVKNAGLTPATNVPRELAVCLSFYAGQNRPRQRGRLYISPAIGAMGVASARPNAATRQKVADLVPIFAGLGGVNADWVVWSKSDQQARKVSNFWVDDAWDVVRSRGLNPTTRLEGTTSG